MSAAVGLPPARRRYPSPLTTPVLFSTAVAVANPVGEPAVARGPVKPDAGRLVQLNGDPD